MTIWQLNDSKNALILYYSHFAKPRWRLSIQTLIDAAGLAKQQKNPEAIDEYLQKLRDERINDLLLEEPVGHDFIQPFMSTARTDSRFHTFEPCRDGDWS